MGFLGSIVSGLTGAVGGFLTGGPVGAVVGGLGGLASGAASEAQQDAAQKAAETTGAAADQATALQRRMYDEGVARQEPWRTAGVNALGQLGTGTKAGGDLIRPFSMTDYTSDPGYSFRLSEGMKQLQNSAAAKGGLLSGSALKGIQRYGQDYASNEYQNAFNRYQTNQGNQFNRLASMAGLGQTANTALGQAGTNYANSAGNIGMMQGANAGNAALMGGNANASAYQGMANNLSKAATSPGSGDYFNDLNTFGGQANAYLQNMWG